MGEISTAYLLENQETIFDDARKRFEAGADFWYLPVCALICTAEASWISLWLERSLRRMARLIQNPPEIDFQREIDSLTKMRARREPKEKLDRESNRLWNRGPSWPSEQSLRLNTALSHLMATIRQELWGTRPGLRGRLAPFFDQALQAIPDRDEGIRIVLDELRTLSQQFHRN